MQIIRYIRQNAFTLVEILISLAILAMIVVSTFTIFITSSKSWKKGESRSEKYHNARTAMGKMSMEISQAVISENSLCKFIGEKERVKFISFVSTSSGIFERSEIEYWLDSDKKVLMRNEDVEPDYDFSTQDYSDILAEGITLLEFSYYDATVWSDTWDKTIPVLPKAVKINLTVGDKKGKESETFEVIIHLKTA